MSTDSLMTGWFYFKPDEPGRGQVGPLTWEQLVALVQTGTLRPSDSVWHQSLPGWLPALQIAGLFPNGGPAYYQQPVAAPPAAPVIPPAAAPPVAQPGPTYAAWNAAPAPARAGGRRRSVLPWLIPVVTVVVVGLALGLYFGLRDRDSNRTADVVTTSSSIVSTTLSTVAPVTTATTTAQADTWLVMMYEDADDEILEEDMDFDVNEAESVGSSDKVKIVAQLDRYASGYSGDGDVKTARRYLLSKDPDLFTLNSQPITDLGKVDMGDPQTLYDFATWAIKTYPAQHYALILSDHGGGWTGGWTDDDPDKGSSLTMQEIDDALGSIVTDTGIGSFELVGYDACLMGQLEVMSVTAPHAKYAVGSEETEPAVGWGYAGFLQALSDDPAMTGKDLSQAIVGSYIKKDVRITDDQARRLLTGGDYTAESVVDELDSDTTLAAVDLSKIEDLNGAVNSLVTALEGADQELVAQARAYAQSYTSVFGEDDPASFIDLGNFADLLVQVGVDNATAKAAAQVKAALTDAVITETHGPQRPGSTGLSIYFPASDEYAGTFGKWTENYASSVGRFSAASLWDDYLTFHYTNESIDASGADLALLTPEKATETDFSAAAQESAPAADAQVVGPGAGQLTIDPITVSATSIPKDGKVTLDTKINGSNIAYVYYYVSYYWPDDGSYLTADEGFIEPGSVKDIGGVAYPDWGDQTETPVTYDWEPTLYYISDGNEDNDQFAFFEPTVYGAEASEDIYTVRGTYTFVDSGTQTDAEMDFNGDGDMQGVWGFSGSDSDSESGSWHEITPQKGDTFTVTEEYLEFDSNPDGEFVDYDGGTMTFGDTPFTMVPYYAYTGDYTLGIGVEDLDGNLTWEFVDVTVTD